MTLHRKRISNDSYSLFLLIFNISAQFASCKSPLYCHPSYKKVPPIFFLFSFRSSKISFLLLASRCRGTILICNFCHRGKQTRALSPSAATGKKKKQINFFPPFSSLHPRQWAASAWNDVPVYWCWCELSVNIRGTRNWRRRWWGIPHAYISADKGAAAARFYLSCRLTSLVPSP